MSADQSQPRPSAPTGAAALGSPDAWQRVTDSSGVFTVALPRGWHHRLGTVAGQYGPGYLFDCQSPDGSTTIYGNDPGIPVRLSGFGELFSGGGGTPDAHTFGADYVTQRYGRLGGFRRLGSTPLPQLAASLRESIQRRGNPVGRVDSATITAEYTHHGTRFTVAALVATFELPLGWAAQATQVVSTGDASSYVDACLLMGASFTMTDAGRRAVDSAANFSRQQHQATMNQIQANTASMTAGHHQRMHDIQAQGMAFQQQMDQRQQTFDAGVQAWREQQATSDAGHSASIAGIREASSYGDGTIPGPGTNEHRNFLNSIRQEETVVDREGWEHQVDAGPDKYYYNDYHEKFIGLENHQDIHDVPGINPDDWYEAPIQR